MPEQPLTILSMHYPPEETGNAPYVGALASGLRARGYRVKAYTAHPHYPEWKTRPGYGQWRRTESIDGVIVERLKHFVPQPPRGLRRLLGELSFGLRSLFIRIPSNSVVLAVSPALFSTAIAVLRLRLTPRRPRVVVWVQDIYTLGLAETNQGSGLTAMLTKAVEKFTLRSADRVVVIHPRFAEYLSLSLGVDPLRIEVIRNWTHLGPALEVDPVQARLALGWPTDVRLAVHTGNMGKKQGLENIVEAARLADAKRAPIKFVLVGEGSERQHLERLGKGVERLEFVAPLSDTDYQFALASADCLLVNELPGVATMSVPSKLTSYFHAARPVLAATDPNGITASEIRKANAGVIVAAGQPDRLLDMALKVVAASKQAASYGEAARRYCAETLTAEAAIASFQQLLDDLAHFRRDASFIADPGTRVSSR